MNNIDRFKNKFNDMSSSLKHLADTYNELALLGQTDEHKAIFLYLNEMAETICGVLNTGKYVDINTVAFVKALKSYGIKANDVALCEVDGKYRKLSLRACLGKGKCITVRELATVISKYFDKKYLADDSNRNVITRDWNEYTFVMAPMFKSVWYVANVGKNGAKVSGDCFSYMTPNCGREIMCIVDGCGSGAIANHDSKLVIELLEEFMYAGFSEVSAISMINAAFSLNDNIGTPQTLDMCVMDLYLGVCNFVKLGAVSTFIKRRDWVEIIKSTTLPMGVLDNIDYDDTVKKLYDGDIIFMVSDGVLEAFDGPDKEETLMSVILECKKGTPKQLAEYIISKACQACNDIIADDMTVAVIMISFTNRSN